MLIINNLYPLKLRYATSTAIWGGDRLTREWNKKSKLSPLAETWELSVREDGMMSYIENGDDAGLSLDEYIKKHGSCVVSDSFAGGRFPLLIKFIDAAKDLSVQVHPDDEYASRVEGDSGKTEMWYIVDAEEGAEIICGLCDGVSREDFAKAVKKNDYSSVLRRVKVKRGESYFIPAGLAHAIGGGILIAEIQQNSDLTYRIYDYDRVGADGKKRQLHVTQALDVVRPFTKEETNAVRYARGTANDCECLANAEYFSVFRIKLDGERSFTADKKSFHCLLAVDGNATIISAGKEYSITRGECVYIPANMGEYTLRGSATVLLSTI